MKSPHWAPTGPGSPPARRQLPGSSWTQPPVPAKQHGAVSLQSTAPQVEPASCHRPPAASHEASSRMEQSPSMQHAPSWSRRRGPGESLDPVTARTADGRQVGEPLPPGRTAEDAAVDDVDPVAVGYLQAVGVGAREGVELRTRGLEALVVGRLVMLDDLDPDRHGLRAVVGDPDLVGIAGIDEELQVDAGGSGRHYQMRKDVTVGGDRELGRSAGGQARPDVHRPDRRRLDRRVAGREQRLDEIDADRERLGGNLVRRRDDLPFHEAGLHDVLARLEVAVGVGDHDRIAGARDSPAGILASVELHRPRHHLRHLERTRPRGRPGRRDRREHAPDDRGGHGPSDGTANDGSAHGWSPDRGEGARPECRTRPDPCQPKPPGGVR